VAGHDAALTDGEWAVLNGMLRDSPQVISDEHRRRLLYLGYITDRRDGELTLTDHGRDRLAKGRKPE
jgi:hypothetical protein